MDFTRSACGFLDEDTEEARGAREKEDGEEAERGMAEQSTGSDDRGTQTRFGGRIAKGFDGWAAASSSHTMAARCLLFTPAAGNASMAEGFKGVGVGCEDELFVQSNCVYMHIFYTILYHILYINI